MTCLFLTTNVYAQDPPTTSLIFPLNNSIDRDSNLTFVCSASDDNNVKNITLYFGNRSTSHELGLIRSGTYTITATVNTNPPKNAGDIDGDGQVDTAEVCDMFGSPACSAGMDGKYIIFDLSGSGYTYVPLYKPDGSAANIGFAGTTLGNRNTHVTQEAYLNTNGTTTIPYQANINQLHIQFSYLDIGTDLDDDGSDDFVTLNKTHAIFNLTTAGIQSVWLEADLSLPAPVSINISKTIGPEGEYGTLTVLGDWNGNYTIAENTTFNIQTARTLHAIETIDIDSNSSETIFQMENLQNGTYSWNCLATDNDSTSAFAQNTFVFTVNLTDGVDEIPPNGVVGLDQSTATNVSITWNWTNPDSADFNHTMIYIDSIFVENTSEDSYNLSGIQPNTTHTIGIRTVDNQGNINFSTVSSNATSYLTEDTIAPDIANLTITTTNESATLTISKDENSTTTIEYGLSDTNMSNVLVNNTFRSNHTVILTALQPSTIYFFRFNLTDWSNNSRLTTIINLTTNATPLPTYYITNISEAHSYNHANISFMTNESANVTIQYGTSLGNLSSEVTNTTGAESHNLTITGLDGNTTYFYRVNVTTLGGAVNWTSTMNFTTNATPLPTYYITNITIVSTNESCIITFSTNETANATVHYGTSTLDQKAINSTQGKNHSIRLSDLSDSTTYLYQINITTSQGMTNWTMRYNFTTDMTPPPTNNITNISVTPANMSSHITFNTNESAIVIIWYGTNENRTNNVSSGEYRTAHNLTITGLVNNTVYYYTINITTAGSTEYGAGIFNFTTEANQIIEPTVEGDNDNSVTSISRSSGTYHRLGCTEWNECQADGKQQRTCKYSCGSGSCEILEEKSCEVPKKTIPEKPKAEKTQEKNDIPEDKTVTTTTSQPTATTPAIEEPKAISNKTDEKTIEEVAKTETTLSTGLLVPITALMVLALYSSGRILIPVKPHRKKEENYLSMLPDIVTKKNTEEIKDLLDRI